MLVRFLFLDSYHWYLIVILNSDNKISDISYFVKSINFSAISPQQGIPNNGYFTIKPKTAKNIEENSKISVDVAIFIYPKTHPSFHLSPYTMHITCIH